MPSGSSNNNLNKHDKMNLKQNNPKANSLPIRDVRRQLKMAEQTMAILIADVRGAQQLSCAPGALAKMIERRSFKLLTKILEAREEISQFNEDIQP